HLTRTTTPTHPTPPWNTVPLTGERVSPMMPPPSPPRVLVVDDDTGVQTLLRAFLQRQGYAVMSAEDGATAVVLAKRELPDLVLLDLQLPVMRGDEVCRQLRQDSRTQLIPIIMLTGNGDFQHKLDAWGYGADDFITKPFQLIEVGARCRSLLRIKSLVEE